MSEVLITGMEMPNTCRRCIEMGIPVHCRVIKQEAVTAVMSGYDRPSDCPLIELPPHGDLIDRDNLAKQTKINICKTGDDYDDMWKAIFDAPTIIEASTSPAGFCNTEGCSNSKPDMSKALNHICPYYQGVCSLDENILCYRQHHYVMCDKFIEVSKEKKWNIRV